MSFTFILDTLARPSLNDILCRIALENVWARSEEGFLPEDVFSYDGPLTIPIIFYQPGQSVRGVLLYLVEKAYQITLYEFTPISDGRLCAAVVQATASAAQCLVRPGNSNALLSAREVAAFCNEEWLQNRRSEAVMALSACTREDNSEKERSIAGYRRSYTVSREIALSLERDGLSKDEIVERFLSEARDLQEIADSEDVATPDILGFLEKETTVNTAPKSFDCFMLSPDLRTLSQPADYVLLVVESEGNRVYRRLPIALFKAHAVARGYRRFGESVFEIPPLPMDEYLELYGQAEPM